MVRVCPLEKGGVSVVGHFDRGDGRLVISKLARDPIPKTDGRMTHINYKPFAAAGIFWMILSATTLSIFTSEPRAAILPFFFILLLVCLDLFFLGKTVAVLSVLLSDQLAEKRLEMTLRLALWGVAKMTALAALIAVIWNAKTIPTLSLGLGLGSLIVIPFLGGLSGSWIEELKKERSRELDHAR